MLWTRNIVPKLFCTIWPCFFYRKCGHLCQVGLFFLVGGLYIISSYYSINEKLLPSQELANETGYTETAFLSNTEVGNIIFQRQHEYERPFLINETVTVLQSIRIGDISPNCGLADTCKANEFSVHIYTGRDHKDEPRLCIDSKYVISRNINDGGRGINAVVIDNITKSVIRVSHFDTYEKESTPLETLLLTLRPGDIVILLTFDEPSRKLSRITRLLLYDLGSALIQNLSYRGSWYLVTQKGISGFSPFEELHLVENSGWPKHHDVRLCVPFEIRGRIIHPDPLPSSNPNRVGFCEKHNDFPLFCDGDVVNDPLSPAPVWKQPAAVNKIYDIPIVIMSGSNIKFLPLTLETLVRQPGIKPSVVTVYYLSKNNMIQNLSELFGYMAEELTPTSNYCERIMEAFEITSLLFPDMKEVILIGENAILSPDFLFFLGQLLPVLSMDLSISAVSALNENGFRSVSGDPTLVYRTESFSSVALLMRKNFLQKSWCSNESIIDPMYISSKIVGEMFIPDVSRVTLAAPIFGTESNQDVSFQFLSHDRTVTYEQNILLKMPERLFREDYVKEVEALLASALPLEFDTKSLLQCMKNSEEFREKLYEEIHLFVKNGTNLFSQVLVTYFYQENEKDISTVQHLTQCFGLFHHPLYTVRGMYKDTLRFMLKVNQAFLVGSKSPFFHLKPKHIPVLRIDQHLGSLVNTMM